MKLKTYWPFDVFLIELPENKEMDLYQKVDGSKAFKVKQGPEIYSVKELYDAFVNEVIPPDVFLKHSINNDFARWIQDVYEDHSLANALVNVKTQHTMIRILGKALNLNL